MAEKVARAGVQKESGFLYFVDKDGDISKAKMVRGAVGKNKPKPQKVAKASIKKEPGFLYFVDKDGDISKAPMSRGR